MIDMGNMNSNVQQATIPSSTPSARRRSLLLAPLTSPSPALASVMLGRSPRASLLGAVEVEVDAAVAATRPAASEV
jgi:hypothetical protein